MIKDVYRTLNGRLRLSALFDPLVFRTGLRARNRIVLAPLTNMQSEPDGSLGDAELRWLTSRAAGGFGVVTTCAAHVSRDGQGWPGELGVHDDALQPGLSTLSAALHEQGAVSIVQIFHGGLRADPALIGATPWSASDVDGARAATDEDIARVIAQFADAAARSRDAGFDGVEIHGAHGYLFTQFLSATQNRRSDAWGGPLEHRARLLRETLRAVRARVGPQFTVGVRLSPEDFGNARGLDLDESVQTARWLADDGADYVHLSLWHVHYLQEEAVRVARGRLGYQVLGGEPQFAGPGELVVWPAGTAHKWWNAGTDELKMTGWCMPPDNVEFFLGALFASVKANGGGRPGIFDAAFLVTRYRTEFALLDLPVVVRRIVIPIVYVVGIALGKYTKFSNAPAPILPEHRVQGLASQR